MHTTYIPTTSTQTDARTKEILAKMFPTSPQSSKSKAKKSKTPEPVDASKTIHEITEETAIIPFPRRKPHRPTIPPNIRNNCPRLYARLRRKFGGRAGRVLGLRESVLLHRSLIRWDAPQCWRKDRMILDQGFFGKMTVGSYAGGPEMVR
ncbi:hypothetical protein EG328_006838 [Venturia inaequalis]|uniref:Uncharacterized protein n=1 Tax=Venturia inaequalis TaxID=5025 RepID=A0A8H3ZGZ8_VENIN|nr:hypothetical protein EG328_006838 [Venturia inaequalis]KAE9991661.1 hypothetical protein EG327_011204 [Venturia inaequalis]RDI76856.1 hypothetical protein Vi05172_g13175 [Venturia inaequalis]